MPSRLEADSAKGRVPSCTEISEWHFTVRSRLEGAVECLSVGAVGCSIQAGLLAKVYPTRPNAGAFKCRDS